MTAKEIKKRTAKRICAYIAQAVRGRGQKAYGLVKPSDKVAVCISGGKDSMLLALLLQDLQHTVILTSCSLQWTRAMRGGPQAPRGKRKTTGHPARNFRHRRTARGRDTLPSTPAAVRKDAPRLYRTPKHASGCNKIALGHHYDDAIGTTCDLLMGLIYGGQVQAMLPARQGQNYEGHGL